MQRIIIVSNRLPFAVVRDGDEWRFEESVGGLATGLSTYLQSLRESSQHDLEYVWLGWPGRTIPEADQKSIRSRARDGYCAYPVFLTEEEVENFYQGFCNKTIWPLFHYFPVYTRYDPAFWTQYESVNRVFCNSLAEMLQPDDLVWVHDYHLMLLPKLLREQFPNNSIGFFLHIPFPAYEIFRLLPATWRKEILDGILGADVIGFHTYEYMQYFLRCVLRIAGHEHNMGQLTVGDRNVGVGTFPMGIDFEKFHSATSDPGVVREMEELKLSMGDNKIVLSIDRLDYSKGIINRLEGFELMLDQHPEWRNRVTLVLIVAPSRVGLDQYELMKRQIEEHVGKTNGKFGTMSWTPIRYQYRSLSFAPLAALYAISDVALITPLRDGMNLISKEYVASRRDATGVLVLSEMAGAVKELGESVIINPNNRDEIAAALVEALEMPEDEQVRRNTIMQTRLKRYDIKRWADEFITDLRSVKQSREITDARLLPQRIRQELIDKHKDSSRRLLLLDYDGTLVGFTRRPKDAKPTDEVIRILCQLAADPLNTLVIISGRDRESLTEWFGNLGIALVAEHGAWLKEPGEDWKLIKQMTSDWKQKVFPMLERHTDLLPGAFVEEKSFSLAWHYRPADPEQAEQLARELMDDLREFTANIDVQVLQGSKVIEVRNAGVNKGTAANLWLSKAEYDFIIAIGDDWTDEDLFAAMPESAYTIRVGIASSRARFNLRTPRDVLQLLQHLGEKRAESKEHRG